MSQHGNGRSERPVREARLSRATTILGTVMGAQFPVHLKKGTEVLVEPEGRDKLRFIAAYGQATAECVVGRNEPIFA